MEYKNVGVHPEDLADGRSLAVGESADLDEEALEHPYNQDLVGRGILIALDEDVKATDAAKALAAEKDVTLTAVTGTGAGGQVTQADVERYVHDNAEEVGQ